MNETYYFAVVVALATAVSSALPVCFASSLVSGALLGMKSLSVIREIDCSFQRIQEQERKKKAFSHHWCSLHETRRVKL